MIKTRVSKIVQMEITEDMLQNAMEKAQEMGKIKNSIRSGEGNLVGFLGEEIVGRFFNISGRNSYNYDLILNGLKLEVKTKETTVHPKEYYDCSVAAYNTRQECDYYIFVRILDDMKKGWILGCITKERYMKESKFLKKGELDSTNNYTVKADCYNMKISELDDIKILL